MKRVPLCTDKTYCTLKCVFRRLSELRFHTIQNTLFIQLKIMIKTTPITPSKKSVRKVGEALRNADLSEAETAEALEILSSWRALYYRVIGFNG